MSNLYNDKEAIEKENWKKAPGIKSPGETNSALAKRDYSKECKCPYCITVIKGYFLWWCSIHHQPLNLCQIEQLRDIINEEI